MNNRMLKRIIMEEVQKINEENQQQMYARAMQELNTLKQILLSKDSALNQFIVGGYDEAKSGVFPPYESPKAREVVAFAEKQLKQQVDSQRRLGGQK